MKRVLGILLTFLLLPVGAYAQYTIFDQGPLTGSNGGCWVNQTVSQNFAEQFSFTEPMLIRGINIFTCMSPVPGGIVHIKILDDAAGTPDNYLYEEDSVPDDWVSDPDSGGYMVTTILQTPFLARANTVYWIGVSGNGFELGQYSVLTPGDGYMATFSGRNFSFHANIGDMMFQLTGDGCQYCLEDSLGFHWCLNIIAQSQGDLYMAGGMLYYLEPREAVATYRSENSAVSMCAGPGSGVPFNYNWQDSISPGGVVTSGPLAPSMGTPDFTGGSGLAIDIRPIPVFLPIDVWRCGEGPAVSPVEPEIDGPMLGASEQSFSYGLPDRDTKKVSQEYIPVTRKTRRCR